MRCRECGKVYRELANNYASVSDVRVDRRPHHDTRWTVSTDERGNTRVWRHVSNDDDESTRASDRRGNDDEDDDEDEDEDDDGGR